MHALELSKIVASSSARALMAIALSLLGWVPLAGLLLALSGCQGPQDRAPEAAVRLPTSRHTALGGSGPVAAGTATFDAPVVNAATWQGTPMGTGQFAVPLTPALSGGPGAIASSEAASGGTIYYVVVQDFGSATAVALAVLSDAPFVTGTLALDPAHFYVAAFDTVTGEPVAEAQSGTLTITAAGAQVTGSLSADFQAIAAPACTSSAQCASGLVCLNGACVATPGCTSSTQCASGQVCQNGVCVSTGGCTSNAQCLAGQVCQRGVCVSSGGCTSNAQCATGQVCQNGACLTSPPVTCLNKRGAGSLSSSQGPAAACSALGTPSVSISSGVALVDDSQSAGPAIVIVDAQSPNAGLSLELAACPAAAGTLTIGAGVEAALYAEPVSSGHVQLLAVYRAVGGTVTFTQVGATLAGTAALTFDNGGAATAQFTLQ